MKNVLITAISNFDNRDDCEYYYFNRDNKRYFTDGIVRGEAGSKYFLSKVKIDKIVLVGSSVQVDKYSDNTVTLGEGINLNDSDVEKLSDFDYFRYRLMQFVDGVDMETLDFLETVSPERQKEILSSLHNVYGESDVSVLDRVCDEPELWDTFNNDVGALNIGEKYWLQRYIYAKSDKSTHLVCPEECRDIPVVFVPILNSKDSASVMNGINLLGKAISFENEEINIYADIQGFNQVDSHIFLNVLGIINKGMHYSCKVKEISSSSDIPKGFVYRLFDAGKRLRVERFISSVNSIIEDGHTKQFREYWQETNIQNEYIDKLMYSLGLVETGVLLCNVDLLAKGVLAVYELVSKPVEIEFETSEEEVFILTLKEAIAADYKKIVDIDTRKINVIELIKWTWNKSYFQQCITIIESKIPGDMIEKGILYPCKTTGDKIRFIRAMNASNWDADLKDRWTFKDAGHYFVKLYGKNYASVLCPKGTKFYDFFLSLRADQIYAENPPYNMLKAYSRITDKELFKEVYCAYLNISSLRNRINHSEQTKLDEDESSEYYENPMLINVKEQLESFITTYEKVLDHIEGTSFDHVDVPQSECDEYYAQHGPKYDEYCFKAEGYLSSKPRTAREQLFPDESKNKNSRKNADAPKSLLSVIKSIFGIKKNQSMNNRKAEENKTSAPPVSETQDDSRKYGTVKEFF